MSTALTGSSSQSGPKWMHYASVRVALRATASGHLAKSPADVDNIGTKGSSDEASAVRQILRFRLERQGQQGCRYVARASSILAPVGSYSTRLAASPAREEVRLFNPRVAWSGGHSGFGGRRVGTRRLGKTDWISATGEVSQARACTAKEISSFGLCDVNWCHAGIGNVLRLPSLVPNGRQPIDVFPSG